MSANPEVQEEAVVVNPAAADATSRFHDELQTVRMGANGKTEPPAYRVERPAGSAEQEASAGSEPEEKFINEAGRHKVQGGETLWSIAQNSLEQAGFKDIDARMIKYEMKRIVYLSKGEHRSLVHNPNAIREGWELQMIDPEDVPARNERLAKYGDMAKPHPVHSKAHADLDKQEQDGGLPEGERHVLLDDKGCPLDTEWKDAPTGRKTHVFNCEKIRAVANSSVIAHEGAEVQAQRGSMVLALPGSRVTALYQSQVASYKAKVDAWSGAQVMEVSSPEAAN